MVGRARFERATIALKVRIKPLSENCILRITPYNQQDNAYHGSCKVVKSSRKQYEPL